MLSFHCSVTPLGLVPSPPSKTGFGTSPGFVERTLTFWKLEWKVLINIFECQPNVNLKLYPTPDSTPNDLQAKHSLVTWHFKFKSALSSISVAVISVFTSTMTAKLGYWKIRGVRNMQSRQYIYYTWSALMCWYRGWPLLVQLAQPIRLLLAYTGTEYEDVKYEAGGRMYTFIKIVHLNDILYSPWLWQELLVFCKGNTRIWFP